MFPSDYLDSLYIKKTCSDEDVASYDASIKGSIKSLENELKIITNPKLAPSFGKQQYELKLARRDYMLKWFTAGLENYSVSSLRKYKSEILDFYHNKCHFSKNVSRFLFDCSITKRELRIEYKTDGDGILYPICSSYISLETLNQYGAIFIQAPLPESSFAYHKFHKELYVKHMLIYDFLNKGYTSTGIAEVLRRFKIDSKTTDSQIRYINI